MSAPPAERLAIALCLLVVLLSATWGFLSEGTWDDDCATRYYTVKRALDHPEELFSTWNRPLYVVLFVLPFQLGPWTAAVGGALILGATCYLCYRAVRSRSREWAWVVVPLVGFQTFPFSISFNALTEPLAGLLLAVCVWAHEVRRPWLLALAAGLLPLARLEMVLLMPVLAFVIARLDVRALALLALPGVIWVLSGAAYFGDALWLLHEVFTGEANRYESVSFGHYFHRYVYVVGPVTFYFLCLGLTRRHGVAWLPRVLFAAGFLTYVVFAWKLSIGHPAGFLRNLVPLAPLAGIVAFDGFTSWLSAIREGRERRRWLLVSLAVLAIAALFLSRGLEMHHFVSEERDLVKPAIVLGLSALLFLRAGRALARAVAAAVCMTAAAYTLVTEPPIRLTSDQEIMRRMADWYLENESRVGTMYVNHIWFFYSRLLDYDSQEFARLTKENIERAEPYDVALLESHYSHRLEGDVVYEDLEGNPAWRRIGSETAPDRGFGAILYGRVPD